MKNSLSEGLGLGAPKWCDMALPNRGFRPSDGTPWTGRVVFRWSVSDIQMMVSWPRWCLWYWPWGILRSIYTQTTIYPRVFFFLGGRHSKFPEVTGSPDHKTALRTAAASIASIGHLVVSFEIQAPKGLVSDLTGWLSWSFGGGQRNGPLYREGRWCMMRHVCGTHGTGRFDVCTGAVLIWKYDHVWWWVLCCQICSGHMTGSGFFVSWRTVNL